MVHEHPKNYYKPNPNSRRHVLFKSKPTVTNFVTYLGCNAFSVCHFWASSGCCFFFILPLNLALFKILLFCKTLRVLGFPTVSQLAIQQPIHHLYIFWVLFNYIVQFFPSPSRICPGASRVQNSYSWPL
jgi:hypothetical protein